MKPDIDIELRVSFDVSEDIMFWTCEDNIIHIHITIVIKEIHELSELNSIVCLVRSKCQDASQFCSYYRRQLNSITSLLCKVGG